MDRGNLVKQVREEMGFTQKELGLRMFVCQQEVSKWETNHITLPHERIFELKDWHEYILKNEEKSKILFQPYIDEIRLKVGKG